PARPPHRHDGRRPRAVRWHSSSAPFSAPGRVGDVSEETRRGSTELMATLLVRDADLVVAMDDADSRWPGGGLYAVDGVIQRVGPTDSLPTEADVVLDGRGLLVMPGLINTHHHFTQ